MIRFRIAFVCAGVVALGGVAVPGAPASESDFAERVDLGAARLIAVQHDGRVQTFDSYARSILKFINASKRFRRLDPVHTYLDMMLRPEQYADQNLIYIKKSFTPKGDRGRDPQPRSARAAHRHPRRSGT